jgi:hypothetical protein
MRRIYAKIAFLVFMVLPYIVYGQACVDTSGQTVSFTLAAGAKASWNSSIAGVLQQRIELRNANAFSVHKVADGRIMFDISSFGKASLVNISLFAINGKQIGIVNMAGRDIGEFNAKLSNGIYFARLEVNGKNISALRILVGR